jgi:hypothetical protein
MDQPAWQRRFEPYVAIFVGLITIASGILIADTGLETKGVHLWEPLPLLDALAIGAVQVAGWGELAMGIAFHIFGIALTWIGIRRLARHRRRGTT